jgi:hypothetical protein
MNTSLFTDLVAHLRTKMQQGRDLTPQDWEFIQSNHLDRDLCELDYRSNAARAMRGMLVAQSLESLSSDLAQCAERGHGLFFYEVGTKLLEVRLTLRELPKKEFVKTAQSKDDHVPKPWETPTCKLTDEDREAVLAFLGQPSVRREN